MDKKSIQPLVSVIVTTCNRSSMLKACLDSILISDYPNKEVIVVNDNSLDETRQVLINYLDRIHVINNETSEYMIRSRNKGASAAHGDYILYVDDDNIIHPSMISHLIKILSSDSKIAVVGPMMYYNCERDRIWWAETIISRKSARTFFPYRNDYRSVITDDQKETDGIPNVFMIRESIFRELGGFDESYIDAWTEGDFSAKANLKGYKSIRVTKAETYHQVTPSEFDGLTTRSIGDSPIKAYATIRNRYVWVGKYFSTINKLGFIFFWSWLILVYYCISAIRLGKKKNVMIYLRGTLSGLIKICK